MVEGSGVKQVDVASFEVFPWNKNFETGHSLVDEQHKHLVSLLNRLARTLVYEEVVEVNAAFADLASYADYHFLEEERVWEPYFRDDYWFSSHKSSHAVFLPKVVELKENDEGKTVAETVEEIVKFLIRWLAFHIIDNDKRMAFVIEAVESGTELQQAKVATEKIMSGSLRVLIETILTMYDGLSSSAIELLREKNARIKAEKELLRVNRRLEELSITDQLTGLYNRRYLNRVFQEEIFRAKRAKDSLTFLLIDIDNFKRYNDTYGHLKGDTALEKVAAVLKGMCRRAGDYAFRIGGEEFGILATSLSQEKVQDFGEQVRSCIENLCIEHSTNETSKYLTVSLGLISAIPSRNDDMDSFFKVADSRLYRAKASGRNQVVSS